MAAYLISSMSGDDLSTNLDPNYLVLQRTCQYFDLGLEAIDECRHCEIQSNDFMESAR